ncbi:MAG TPA: phosphomethylpyrimidine synthase ThiC [Spirochaetota bacterium]|nr:phosphomethylpyrimidine synthase ThiC [Spirochaetota bacterium]HOR45702.1 phosphomethylpyrimidine synthase ThiC [Spirochaetota bacterium]HPK57318.1 phosphomethylpyrimidine synthase ThiC [Spirochaetota bacterium]
MTQIESALKGIITDQMNEAAALEGIDASALLKLIASGKAVIPFNKKRKAKPAFAVGKDLLVKINANIGTSPKNCDIDYEMKKLHAAVSAGAEAVMDLSIGGDVKGMRRRFMEECTVATGCVPAYSVITKCKGNLSEMEEKDFIDAVYADAECGIDFATVHCGITMSAAEKASSRIMGITSRGGSIISKWMKYHKKENPFFTHFDEICAIAKEFDITLSLGDALRPGGGADAGDSAQMSELSNLGELTLIAREKGVQVMVEGPGHVPLHLIENQIKEADRVCHGAPFFVLGPLVTDSAPGYDHITGAIGGALAGMHGAAFLCYLTPAEHLRLPSVDDVVEGVIASKIAAHAANIAKGIPSARVKDEVFSKARRDFDWEKMFELAVDPVKARKYREGSTHSNEKECSMCGEFCAMKEEFGAD